MASVSFNHTDTTQERSIVSWDFLDVRQGSPSGDDYSDISEDVGSLVMPIARGGDSEINTASLDVRRLVDRVPSANVSLALNEGAANRSFQDIGDHRDVIVRKRLENELRELHENPLPNCAAGPVANDIFHWQATIIGPDNSPYAGGIFFLDLLFPKRYPFQPPRIRFDTRIYHCNVGTEGEINLDQILGREWSCVLSVGDALESIFAAFTNPNPKAPQVREIALILQRDREKHDSIASKWTSTYAM